MKADCTNVGAITKHGGKFPKLVVNKLNDNKAFYFFQNLIYFLKN